MSKIKRLEQIYQDSCKNCGMNWKEEEKKDKWWKKVKKIKTVYFLIRSLIHPGPLSSWRKKNQNQTKIVERVSRRRKNLKKRIEKVCKRI